MLDFKYMLLQLLRDKDVGWYAGKYMKSPISLCRENKVLLLLVRRP